MCTVVVTVVVIVAVFVIGVQFELRLLFVVSQVEELSLHGLRLRDWQFHAQRLASQVGR